MYLMNEIDIKTARLHAKMLSYQKKLAVTEDNIIKSLQIAKKPMVSFSCGKDSAVLAHMVLKHSPRTPLRFLSSGETRIVHDVDKVIDWFKGIGANVQEINIDRVFSDDWQDATWTEQRKAGNKDMLLLNEGGWDMVFIGLRKEESHPREITLAVHQTKGLPRFCYKYKDKEMIRCCPLANWTTMDISAYLQQNKIPVLSWYEQFSINSRTTARITGDAARQNVIAWIKASNPAGFNKLIERFPEFGTYV